MCLNKELKACYNKTLNNKPDSTKNELVQHKNDNRLLKIRLDDVNV